MSNPVKIELIDREHIQAVVDNKSLGLARLELVAAMCRFNTFNSVKRAKSGHLGTSFSAMDIVTYLYFHRMNTLAVGVDSPDRDIYFSSKGHDVPGLYSVLYAGGVLPKNKVLMLRRFGGLDGHPDVKTRGIEANSGSLGMGISKGRGMAWAKRKLGRKGTVTVMLGDGELQEGQIWESLQVTAHQKLGNLTVIIDHNKVQSDLPIDQIVSLGDLEAKLKTFNWEVRRCDGHDYAALDKTFTELDAMADRPKIIIADTIKGAGISFMEHPAALAANSGLYRWHSGAPDDKSFSEGVAELKATIAKLSDKLGLAAPAYDDMTEATDGEDETLEFQNQMGEPVSLAHRSALMKGVSSEYVAEAYGRTLVELGKQVDNMVVLDADLSADCRLREFEHAYPDRFIECGIAEMDMVSMAGGLASQGLIPVVNSFASFLAARANEQAYNNSGEGRKIIYAMHYAGLIPAGPGKSHQSVRDISLFAALDKMTLIQPCNAAEAEAATAWAVKEAAGPVMLRLVIGPSPEVLPLPENYKFEVGKGAVLHEGDDAVIFGYGPVMLHEAMSAARQLKDRGFGLRVVNMPWLNKIDSGWLREVVTPYEQVYVIEDHAPVCGLADRLLTAMHEQNLTDGRRVQRFGVEGLPACGTPVQAMTFHGLDGTSLADRIGRTAVVKA